MEPVTRPDIRALVSAERHRQDFKWGPIHDRNVSLVVMAVVLQEEVGEVAQAILKGPVEGRDNIKLELVQVVAVASAILEELHRLPFGLDYMDAG